MASPRPPPWPHPDLALLCLQPAGILVMEDCNVHSAASILASVKEQEARFQRLTRALEQERRHVALQLERAQQPGVGSGGVGSGQPLPMAWQQLVLQVTAQRLRKDKTAKWENNQGALVGHKPACIGLLQDLLGPLGRGGKWDSQGARSPIWVCWAPHDEWAGHSLTLKTAPFT